MGADTQEPGEQQAAHAGLIADELGLSPGAVAAALGLMADGGTVPFVARYRKEATGGLDEQQLRAIEARGAYLDALADRRRAIEKALAKLGKLSDELLQRLRAAQTKVELEDLYAPHKPRRRTRAAIARERGLGPLSDVMWAQGMPGPAQVAGRFVSAAREVPDAAAALAGARDICAERIGDDPQLRARIRASYLERGCLRVTKVKAHRDAATKFDSYAAFEGRVRDMPSHRVLAIERGAREGVLRAKVEVDAVPHFRAAAAQIPLRDGSPWRQQLREVVEDAVKRILSPSAESYCRSELRARAERAAVEVFARNLRDLLLAPAFGARPVLGIDPGQRTGCKCAVVGATGELLAHDVVYLVQGEGKLAQARAALRGLIARHGVQAVAVGNGTHGRETEAFVRTLLADGPGAPGEGEAAAGSSTPICVSVSESGASIYSASEVARREFPDLDLTVRGAISIARRLQDPLAELAKLDPKSIGVGQYQHDIDAGLLSAKLAEVVEGCVNSVGVQLNSASAELLASVAGIGPKTAAAIVAHRNQHGAFGSRAQLLKVKGLGPRAYEQAAGFLRVSGGRYPLDASAVHPERYAVVERMAADLQVTLGALVGDAALVDRIDPGRYRSDALGDYTLGDILAELRKPGRDPRDRFEAAAFRDGVNRPEDLEVGMRLQGVVTNVTAFGAFVDVGVHQDGLVHVSQLADAFVRDPADVAHVGQRLNVRVLEVDLVRGRISLSAKAAPER